MKQYRRELLLRYLLGAALTVPSGWNVYGVYKIGRTMKFPPTRVSALRFHRSQGCQEQVPSVPSFCFSQRCQRRLCSVSVVPSQPFRMQVLTAGVCQGCQRVWVPA